MVFRVYKSVGLPTGNHARLISSVSELTVPIGSRGAVVPLNHGRVDVTLRQLLSEMKRTSAAA